MEEAHQHAQERCRLGVAHLDFILKGQYGLAEGVAGGEPPSSLCLEAPKVSPLP